MTPNVYWTGVNELAQELHWRERGGERWNALDRASQDYWRDRARRLIERCPTINAALLEKEASS